MTGVWFLGGGVERSEGVPDLLITSSSDNAYWLRDSSEDESGYAT
nr:hypothetical protein [uncultured Methanospirillum sp.]